MASAAVSRDVITVIVQEMSCAVDRSVEYWMAQLDEALTDTRLTTLGRLDAVSAIISRYNDFPGTSPIPSRPPRPPLFGYRAGRPFFFCEHLPLVHPPCAAA